MHFLEEFRVSRKNMKSYNMGCICEKEVLFLASDSRDPLPILLVIFNSAQTR
jgi:hypothetical protein